MIGGNYIQCLVIIVIFLGLKGEKKVGGFHNHDMEVASHKGDGRGGRDFLWIFAQRRQHSH